MNRSSLHGNILGALRRTRLHKLSAFSAHPLELEARAITSLPHLAYSSFGQSRLVSLIGPRSPLKTINATSAISRCSLTQPPGSTIFSHPYSTKSQKLENLVSQIPEDTKVDLQGIMNDLRDLELLDLLKGSPQKSGNSWKDAARSLYPLYHLSSSGAKSKRHQVKFSDLIQHLPSIYSLAWTVIGQRISGGGSQVLEALGDDDRSALKFLQIHAVGPTFARKFVAAGAYDLASLKKLCKLTRAQEIGIRHIEDINLLIPRSEMEALSTAVSSVLASFDPTLENEILGSYRRGVAFSSDIDMVVRHKSFVDGDDADASKEWMERIVEALGKEKLVKEENLLTNGVKKFSGLIKLPKHKHYRRIDVRIAPYFSYPYMLLGSTGDSLLMKFVRHIAKTKGFCLNEYGMGDKYAPEDQNPNGFKPGTMKVVRNEKEIFELLGLPYLAPTERDFSTWQAKYKAAGMSWVISAASEAVSTCPT